MFKVEDKELTAKTKFIYHKLNPVGLINIAFATGNINSWSIGDQYFVCRHEALF